METLIPPAPVRPRRPRITLWALKVLLTVHVVAVLVQPVLAGRYLTGDVDAMTVHGLMGSMLVLVTMVVVVVALLYVVVGRGRVWVLGAAVLLFFGEGFQIGAGYTRQLGLHVPLGVAIVVVAVALAAWVWTPSAARPRGAR